MSEVREVVVKRGEFQRNPDTDRMNLVYNEHVEMVEVPISLVTVYVLGYVR